MRLRSNKGYIQGGDVRGAGHGQVDKWTSGLG